MTHPLAQANPSSARPLISGCAAEEFTVSDHRAFAISPAHPPARPARPWVWYAPTLPGLPAAEETWMFEQFLGAGVSIAGIDVGESFGNPSGRALFTGFYQQLVHARGMSRRPVLLARSRGGLMLYNWAAEHPEAVAAIAGIYPVCNLASYPGLGKACAAYALTETELAAGLAEHNPLERLAPLARAGVPVLHLHGGQDAIVPLQENSAALAERYRALGGEVRVIVYPERGHDYWPGWFQSPELVRFVIAHAK